MLLHGLGAAMGRRRVVAELISVPSTLYVDGEDSWIIKSTQEWFITINGEAAASGTGDPAQQNITVTPTAAMAGVGVTVLLTSGATTDTETRDVIDALGTASLTLQADPSDGVYAASGAAAFLKNQAATGTLVDANVDNWLEQNTVCDGAGPYAITETVSAAAQHTGYKASTGGTGGGQLLSLDCRRGSGTRNVQIRAGATEAVQFDLGAGTKGTETNALGTIGAAVGGFYPLTLAAVNSSAFVYVNLLSGTSISYAGDGSSSLEVQNVVLRRCAWQSAAGSRPAVATGSLTYDATDDFLNTQVSPTAAAGTLWAWVKRSNVGVDLRAALGSEVGAEFCSLGLDANHFPIAQIGAQDATTIKGGDGDDVPIEWVFLAVTWDGATVTLYSDDGQTQSVVYAAAQSGVVPEAQAVFVGAINDDGVADTFWAGNIGQSGVSSAVLSATTLHGLALVTQPDIAAPTLALPDAMVLVSGESFVMRDEDLALGGIITVTATCPYTHAAGVATLSPSAPGSYSVTVTVQTRGGVASKTVALDVVSAATPTLNLLVVGDSITAAGYYVDSLLTDGAAANITPLGLTVTTAGSHPVEGHGGWGFAEYRDGATSPMAPSGVIDIPAYITALGATPNVIVWALGTNDVFGMGPGASLEAAITAAFEDFDQLKAAWDAIDATIVHVLALPAPGNARQSAFDNNYSGTNQDRWKFRQGIHRWNERALTAYDGGDVVVVPLGLGINQTDGYPADNALHPDASGGTEMAPALLAYLQSP